MTIDTINDALRQRFDAPLRDCYERRIIFWHDSEREFEDMLDELDIPGVKLLVLTGDNYFEAKMILAETDTTSNYLVYDPNSYRNTSEIWLRDIELYSEEYRADNTSMLMDELNIPQTTALRRAVKLYAKFFSNKERTAKFVSFKTKYDNPVQLHIDVMAALCGASTNTASGVIRAVLCGSPDEDENKALDNIRKFGSEEVFRDMLAKYTGYADSDFSLSELTSHILITAFSVIGDAAVLTGLERYISADCQPFCSELIDDWADSDARDKLYELSGDIAEQFSLIKKLSKLDTDLLLKYDDLPCFDECIIDRFMSEAADNMIKYNDVLKAVTERRTSKWYSKYANYYDGLYYMAKMREFELAHSDGYHYSDNVKLWNDYCSDLYLMDTYYREFHTAFSRNLRSSYSTLDDMFKTAAETVEGMYKEGFLKELNANWHELIGEDLETSGRISGIVCQSEFYKNNVAPVVHSSGRVFVIISDALRYETAKDLNEKLLRETNGTAEITAMQSVMPSITRFGMAALLPHTTMSITDDLNVLCDDKPTSTTSDREAVLKNIHAENCAVTYTELLSMKQAQRRSFINGAQTVYIYHNRIDDVGDTALTESRVFDACKEAEEELKNLVTMIVNSLSGSNIIITSDHGFLYTYAPLSEYDKADKNLVTGNIYRTGHRYIIAGNKASSEYLFATNMSEYGDKYSILMPKETIRIKKQGAGVNYVHGGTGLQECCVPGITFRNIRAGSKKFVGIKKAEVQLLSRTRKISNNIFTLEFFQKAPVGGKLVPAEFDLYFTDEASNKISTVQTLIADSSETEARSRVTKIRFTLRGTEFDGNAPYYLNIADKADGTVLERIEFSVKIAFSNDFDF